MRIVVPFPPGGSNDVIARAAAPSLAKRLGTSVIVDNRAGAAGVIGSDSVAKGPRDVSAVLLTSSTLLTTAATQSTVPCELHYTVYGRDGIMGALEPLRARPAHELCVMVQGVAPTAEMAEEVCMTGTRQMFYARLPQVKGSAGSVAFALDEVLRASPAYRWTLNHTLACAHPLELFPTHMTTAGT